jgi:diguanylate cyclase (GGDEF)-like protein/PAS domain S-box-containing protein
MPARGGAASGGVVWRRLHAALMPDYNRLATAYWWVVVGVGGAVFAACVAAVLAQPWPLGAQVLVGLALALGAGLFPVRVPGTKESFVAGEIFIFLVLLMHGPQAAAVVAAAEAFMGSYRSSRRWTSRLGSPASAALAMWSTGTLQQAALGWWGGAGDAGAAVLLACTLVCAVLYFFVNAVLTAGLLHLKRGEAFFQPLGLVSVFRWVGLAYAGSAAVATLLHVVQVEQGAGVLLVMLPLLVLLLVTLHFYFRQQEADATLREARSDMAAREAALAQRESQAAERHLRELQTSERHFHSAFTHAAIGMALLGFDGLVLQANPALLATLDLPAAALLRRPIQWALHEDDRAELERLLGLAGQRDFEGFTRELRCRHGDGVVHWLALHCSFFTDPGDASPCLILQVQDVTARRNAEAGLADLAFHDALTGLPNRRRFLECLAGAVSRHQADARHSWAVMFIDFDRFKLVNDSLGHGAGDELLRQMARRVQEALRPSDVLARLGGDEFAILAESINHERDAVVLAERLMEALRRPFLLGEVELIASASIGITFSALGYGSADEVLRDADTAMYKAKSGGKARYALFDASLHTAVAARLRLEGELHRAIEKGQLTVVYQPVFHIGVGGKPRRLSGFEALVRWQHPDDGLLEPAAFLPIAEESGMMLQLSDFVLHCACQQLRQWQLSDPALAGLTMSINLSAQDLAHPALVARVSRALVEADLRAQDLTLELTENILMAQIDGAHQTLAELRRLGTRLAVDDFGTGYSSLSHLSRLPIDTLKIDRSFVAELQRGSDEAIVVGAIIQLGDSLHKSVVAEGIETESQMAQLRELGCSFGQGFHLASPLSARAAGEWLRAQRGQLH